MKHRRCEFYKFQATFTTHQTRNGGGLRSVGTFLPTHLLRPIYPSSLLYFIRKFSVMDAWPPHWNFSSQRCLNRVWYSSTLRQILDGQLVTTFSRKKKLVVQKRLLRPMKHSAYPHSHDANPTLAISRGQYWRNTYPYPSKVRPYGFHEV